MTPAARARARTEARRLLGIAAEHRAVAEHSQNPGMAEWGLYTADELVKEARRLLSSIGETVEHLAPRPVEPLTPIRRNVVHLDDRWGSGIAACGADIYPRVRLDLAPAASSWPGFYRAARLGSACPKCLEEADNHHSQSSHEHSTRSAHVLG